MREYFCLFFGVFNLFPVCLGMAQNRGIENMIASENPEDRINGFWELVELEIVGGKVESTCKFKISDAVVGKKWTTQLLAKERAFDFDRYYQRNYGVKVVGENVYKRKREKKFREYLFAKEGYGEYVANLESFVDSCAEESAVPLFPGQKTFDRYPEESVKLVFEKMEKARKNKNLEGVDLFEMLGKSALKLKDSDKKIYGEIKSRLMGQVDSDCFGNAVVEAMGIIGDADFIPALEKISLYDESKGCMMVLDGKQVVFPISRDARRVLKKLGAQKH